MYCYAQKLSAATLIVLSESKSRLSAARIAYCRFAHCSAIVRVSTTVLSSSILILPSMSI